MSESLDEMFKSKSLTYREREVAFQVARGLINKEVGHQLSITEKTVKFHMTSILRKLGLKTREQLQAWCVPYIDWKKDV